MTKLKTNASLLTALKEAASETHTAAEIEEQRISFIMGSLQKSGTVTRAKIMQVLESQQGKKTKAK